MYELTKEELQTLEGAIRELSVVKSKMAQLKEQQKEIFKHIESETGVKRADAQLILNEHEEDKTSEMQHRLTSIVDLYESMRDSVRKA